MIYITVRQSPMYHQMSLEEFLFQPENFDGTSADNDSLINPNTTNTRTYEFDRISPRMQRKLPFNTEHLISVLERFNAETEELRQRPRKELYNEFYIPKKSGGFRKIDAPNQELMNALRKLKTIFENDFRVLYHTAAFAYVRGRCTIDAVKRHQANESRWFAKFDLHNFFGSTTLDFITSMFSMIYPFSEVMKTTRGFEQLRTALELAILDGGLPQGTPISPLITNIMMIPVDFKLANTLRDYNKQRFVYTRYADDFQISSRYDFSYREIENLIESTLAGFHAPFSINRQKTRYGSSSGSNWNLGVMLNKDNKITIGYKKKRQFKAMLSSFAMDTINGTRWDKNDVQVLDGYCNYYRMVEGDAIDEIIANIGTKFQMNLCEEIKNQLRLQ